MDIYSYLKNDHEKVNQLFEKIFSCDDESIKEDTFEELMEELNLHAEAEEVNFYPVLQKFDDTKDLAKHSMEEHAKVKQLLKEISQTPADEEGWDSKVKELQENVLHHVKEEEEEIFPKAKACIDDDQAKNMLDAVKKFKEKQAAL